MLGTIITGIILLVAIIAAICFLVKNHKKGKSVLTCGTTCSGCPMAGECHKKEKDIKKA